MAKLRLTRGKFKWQRYHVWLGIFVTACLLVALDTLCYIWAGRTLTVGAVTMRTTDNPSVSFYTEDNPLASGRYTRVDIRHIQIVIN